MIVLQAKEKMTYQDLILTEAELSEKLDSDVVIIPAGFEIVTLNHIGDYEELDNDLEYNPDDVKLTIKEAIEKVEKHFNQSCSNGCKCNG